MSPRFNSSEQMPAMIMSAPWREVKIITAGRNAMNVSMPTAIIPMTPPAQACWRASGLPTALAAKCHRP